MKLNVKGMFADKEINITNKMSTSNIAPVQNDSTRILQEGLNNVSMQIVGQLKAKKDLDLSRMKLDFNNEIEDKLSQATLNPSLTKDKDFMDGINTMFTKYSDVVNNYNLFNEGEKDVINKQFTEAKIKYNTEFSKIKLNEITKDNINQSNENFNNSIEFIGKTRDLNLLRNIITDSTKPYETMNFETGIGLAEQNKLIGKVSKDEQNNIHGIFDYRQLNSLGNQYVQYSSEKDNKIKETAIARAFEIEKNNGNDTTIMLTNQINNKVFNKKIPMTQVIDALENQKIIKDENGNESTTFQAWKENYKTTIEQNQISETAQNEMYKNYIGGIMSGVYNNYANYQIGEVVKGARSGTYDAKTGLRSSDVMLKEFLDTNNYLRTKGYIDSKTLDAYDKNAKTEYATEIVQREKEEFQNDLDSKARDIINSGITNVNDYKNKVANFFLDAKVSENEKDANLKNSLIVSGIYKANETDDFNFNVDYGIYNTMFEMAIPVTKESNGNKNKDVVEGLELAQRKGNEIPKGMKYLTDKGDGMVSGGSYLTPSSKMDFMAGSSTDEYYLYTDGKTVKNATGSYQVIKNEEGLLGLDAVNMMSALAFKDIAHSNNFIPSGDGPIIDIVGNQAKLKGFYFTGANGKLNFYDKTDKNELINSKSKNLAWHLVNGLNNQNKDSDPVGWYINSTLSQESKDALNSLKSSDTLNEGALNKAQQTLISEFMKGGLNKIVATNLYNDVIEKLNPVGLDKRTARGTQILASKKDLSGAEYNKTVASSNKSFYVSENKIQKSINFVKDISTLKLSNIYESVNNFNKQQLKTNGIFSKMYDDRVLDTTKLMLTLGQGGQSLPDDFVTGVQSAFVLANEGDPLNNDLISKNLSTALHKDKNIVYTGVYFGDTNQEPSTANAFLMESPDALSKGKTREQVKDISLNELKKVLWKNAYDKMAERKNNGATNYEKGFNDEINRYKTLFESGDLRIKTISKNGETTYIMTGANTSASINASDLGYDTSDKNRLKAKRIVSENYIDNWIKDSKVKGQDKRDIEMFKATKSFFGNYYKNGERVSW